jgi:AcrR family transcriptional regulator
VPATGGVPLSRERILRCAVDVADQDGLDATSLRRVAAGLGVHVTSLYNHVPTKEALLDGVAEQLVITAEPPLGEVDWETWVRGFVDAVIRLANAHPGASEVLMRRPVQGPAASATFEAGLRAFQQAGMDIGQAYAAVKSVSLAVLGCVLEAASRADDVALGTDVDLLPRDDFPMIHEVVAIGDEVSVVDALTEVLVAGFAHRIAALA